jgi:hypothetical protein
MRTEWFRTAISVSRLGLSLMINHRGRHPRRRDGMIEVRLTDDPVRPGGRAGVLSIAPGAPADVADEDADGILESSPRLRPPAASSGRATR